MKLLAVDGNNLLMRALFATKRANMTAHGVLTGPLLVFVNSLSRHIREENPTHIGIAWDAPGRGMRGNTDEGYKANRIPMPDDEHELKQSAFALTKEFCSLAGLFQVGYDHGGVEADDIIGAWWRGWVAEPAERKQLVMENPMVILSSDKDLLQLVDRPGVEQVRLSSSNTPTDRWNSVSVASHYGVPASAIPALLAIMGDTSDNIIGVKGIGPKKAAKALQEDDFDFEACIRKRWPDEVDHLMKNYRLTDLRGTWPHEAVDPPSLPPGVALMAPGDPLWSRLRSFLDSYELRTVRERLEAGTLWRDPPVGIRRVGQLPRAR